MPATDVRASYLDRHGAHDGTLVTFKGFRGDIHYFIVVLIQELLAGGKEHLSVVRRYFHLFSC